MCDQCDDPVDHSVEHSVDRRLFLRRAVAGGITVMAGTALFPAAAEAGRATAKGTTVGTRAVTVDPPSIVTRAQWGADEKIRDSARVFAPIRKLVVHHSASPNHPADPASVVRDIYALHVKGRGYQDIGYNFLIDHHGVVYEGRWARAYPAGQLHDGEDGHGRGVMGGHATTVNAGACGVCLIGDFTFALPSTAALTSLVQLLAWKAGRFMIDPSGADPFAPPYGAVATFPNIVGHRGVGSTVCPGRGANSQLPWVRSEVQQQVGRFPAVTLDLLHALHFTNGASYPKPTLKK